MTQLIIKNTPDALGYILVYLSGVDGKWDDAESKIIGDSVAEMCGAFQIDLDGDGDTDIDDVIISIDRAFDQLNACDTLDDAIAVLVVATSFLKDVFTSQNREVLVSRMRKLIGADGVITKGEEKTVDLIEEMLMG